MIDLDWISKAALAAAGAIASGVVASAFWLMRLGNRVTALETRMTIIEQTHAEAHRTTLEGIERIRQSTTAIVQDLHGAREEALRFFAERDDLKGLEEKIDKMQESLAELSRAQAARHRTRRRE